jgi:hypothetical protein
MGANEQGKVRRVSAQTVSKHIFIGFYLRGLIFLITLHRVLPVNGIVEGTEGTRHETVCGAGGT